MLARALLTRAPRRLVRRASSSAREYDLVLFGATGFSGRLVASYLARAHGQRGLRVALGGRDRAKLEAVAAALPGPATPRVVVADASSDEDMKRLAASTEVVASTAGPFRKFGSKLVAACAAEGASYCDITGEASWVAAMAHAHDETARSTGAALVPAAGFDSVPSDLGTLMTVRAFEKEHGAAPERVDAYVTSMRGGAFQGGTVDTMAYELTDPAKPAPRLKLKGARTKIDWRHGSPFNTATVGGRSLTLSPFLMAGANCPVVRRSNELLNYRDGLVYSESMALRSKKAAFTNAGMLAVGAGLLKYGALDFLRSRGYLPKSGEGPTEKQMRASSYAYSFVATGAGGARTEGTWKGLGDPSCIQTSMFLVETALGLLERRGAADATGGLLTPASALGEGLWARLEDARWEAGDEAPAVTWTTTST